MPTVQPSFDELTLLARLARLTELNTESSSAGALFADLGEPGWTALAPDVPGFTPNGFYIAGQPPIPVPNAEGVLLHNPEAHALAIGFRGVGGAGGVLGRLIDFYETGFDQDGHFAKFAPMLNAAAEFIAAQDPDNAIETIYVGGHSLGGAMVQQVFAAQDGRFFNDDLTIVGATFASPGARDVPEEPIAAERELLHTGGEGDPVFGLLDNSAVLLPLVAAVGPTVENVVAQFGIDLDSFAEAQEVLAFPSLPRGGTLDSFEMPLLSTVLDPATLTLPQIHSNSLNAQAFGELNELGITTQEFLTAERVVAYVTPDGVVASDDVFASDNQGNDIVAGFAGSDLLFGGVGDDVIGGGEDSDTVGGNRGDDRLYGQEGSDLLLGSLGEDLLFGGPQSDTLHGDSGDDQLFGGGSDDQLFGGRGDDLLDGEADNDLYVGDGGEDAFVFVGESFGADLVADFTSGGDHLRLIDVLDADGDAVTAFEDLDDNRSGAIEGDDDSALHTGDALVLTLGAGQITLASVDSLAPADVEIAAVS
jgi:hypothetical protein